MSLLKRLEVKYGISKLREEILEFEMELRIIDYSTNFKQYSNLKKKIRIRRNKIDKHLGDVVGAIKEFKEFLRSGDNIDWKTAYNKFVEVFG